MMTEKRFTVKPLMFIEEQRKGIFEVGGDRLFNNEIVGLLNNLAEENERLKKQLDDNLQFLIRASKRLGFESLDHLLYTLDKGEITGYTTANWEKGDVE